MKLVGWTLAAIQAVMLHSTACSETKDASFVLGRQTLERAMRCPVAMRIAHQRYHFLTYVKGRIEGFYLEKSLDGYCTALFPIARSDRMYAIGLPLFNATCQHPMYRLYCFQREGSTYKLVYRVDLEYRSTAMRRRTPVAAVSHVSSLLGYLTIGRPDWVNRKAAVRSISYVVNGRIGSYAKGDLAAVREYVEYDYQWELDNLQVSLLSQHWRDYMSGEWYMLDRDPLTGAKLNADQFYSRYGLPIAKEDLTVLLTRKLCHLTPVQRGSRRRH